MSHLAALIKTKRLGTAVVVAPWQNPLLLAEQAATTDRMTDALKEARFTLHD